jgi:hypothetical protein
MVMGGPARAHRLPGRGARAHAVAVTLGEPLADQLVHGGLYLAKRLLELASQVPEIVAVGRWIGDEFEQQPSLELVAVASRRRGTVGGPADRVVLHRRISSCAGPGDVASVARGALRLPARHPSPPRPSSPAWGQTWHEVVAASAQTGAEVLSMRQPASTQPSGDRISPSRAIAATTRADRCGRQGYAMVCRPPTRPLGVLGRCHSVPDVLAASRALAAPAALRAGPDGLPLTRLRAPGPARSHLPGAGA